MKKAKLVLGNDFVRMTTDLGTQNQVVQYFTYNDDIRKFEKKNGCEFDDENREHLESILWETHNESYQNWICFRLYGECINIVQDNPSYDALTNPNVSQKGKPFSKNYMTDGYRSVVSVLGTTAKFRSGLLGMAINFLQKDLGVEIELIDQREDVPQLTPEPVYSVGKYHARPDQIEVIDKFRAELLDTDNMGHLFTSILLKLAVNTGKTIIAGILVANIEKPKIIMLFRETYLCARAVADYLKMGFNVGCIAADQKEVKRVLRQEGCDIDPKWAFTDFTIMMVQTLDSRLKKGDITINQLRYFNLELADECEQLVGDQTLAIRDKAQLAMKIAYSGTPLDSDSGYNRMTVLGCFGSQIFEITTAQNNERGISQRAVVNFSLNTFRGISSWKIGSCKDACYSDKYRLETLIKRIEFHFGQGRRSGIVYYGEAQRRYGDWLMEKLVKHFGLLATIEHVNGKVKGRAEIFTRFVGGDIDLLVANEVVKRGVNLPNIRVFYNWETTDNDISSVQAAIGRGSRTDGGKNDHFYVEDFYDSGNDELEGLARHRIKLFSKAEHGADIHFLYPCEGDGTPK